MDTLALIKTIVEMVVSLIGAIFPPVKAFLDAKSQTSTTVMQGFTEISHTMDTPEREKIDVERLRAFAELTRSIIPFAWVEYAFFVTKVVMVLVYMFYALEKIPRKQ